MATLELYLLRHADAGDPAAWTGDDAARPLSAKGRRQATRLGAWLAALGWRPDVVRTSPKIRAAETARVVADALGGDVGADGRLASGFGIAQLGALLHDEAPAARVLLVGHDPDFSDLASTLTGARLSLSKGALARIDLPDGLAVEGAGELRWLVPPGALPR